MRIETEHTNVSTAAAPHAPDDAPGAEAPDAHADRPQSETSQARNGDPVVVRLSPEAMALLEEGAGWKGIPDASEESAKEQDTATFDDPEAIFGTEKSPTDGPESDIEMSSPTSMSALERSRLAQLRMTDAAVRSLQFSRIAVAGSLANGLSTEFTSGPDGRLYATSGEVKVNTQEGATPRESLSRASTLRRVSSTPAIASAVRRPQENMAVQAAQIEFAARSELHSLIMNAASDTQTRETVPVLQRDTHAANEAANWSAPPEFTPQGVVESDEADVSSGTKTELSGAAAVTQVEDSVPANNKARSNESNLKMLFEDLDSIRNSDQSLDIVA